MPAIHELPIEPLTEEAFAPFGQIISTKERAPDFRTESGTEGWAVDFRSGRPLVMVLRTRYQELRFSKLERHFELTQTFLPLGGSPAAVAVAPPSSDRSVIPDPTEVRAFLLDGTKGYALAPGTWHSLDRFPLYPPDTRWVIITDHETQQDLLAAYSGKGGWERTQEADYRATLARTLRARANAHKRSLSEQIKYYAHLAVIAEDNPDLPLSFIQGILEGQEEIKAGLGRPYRFGVIE